MNLEKLTKDAKLARSLAEAAALMTVDNGTCNLDATFLRLNRGQLVEPVAAALRAGGLSGFETRWCGRGILILPPGVGLANKRHAANEAMYEALRGAGWPVLPYYQID